MSKESPELFSQPEVSNPDSNFMARMLPSDEETHMAELEKEEVGNNNPVMQARRTVTYEEMVITQKARRRTERRREAQLDGRGRSKARGRERSVQEHIENQAKLHAKFGSEQMVVEGELAQVLGPDPDFSSSPSTYVPLEDPQILAKLNQPKIDLSRGAKIPHGLPDPIDQQASLIRSTTNNSEIADIFIKGQTQGDPNGPGPSQIEPFSLNPLHRWMAPDTDDFGSESRP